MGGGLAAIFLVELSLSTFRPVGGSGIEILGGIVGRGGSDIFGGIFAKYFGASGRGLAAKFSVEFSLSILGPVGGFGSKVFGGIVAKYFGASRGIWQQNCRWNFR